MITTVSFADTATMPHGYHSFLVVRTFKIYSLGKFQICKTVLLSSFCVLYPRTPLSYNWNRVPFDQCHAISPPPPAGLGNHHSTLCSCEVIRPFQIPHISDITQHVFLWLNSLSRMPAGPVTLSQRAGFPSAPWPKDLPVQIIQMPYLLLYSSAEGHVGCFHTLAVINNAAMDMGTLIALHYPVFISSGYILCSGNAGT